MNGEDNVPAQLIKKVLYVGFVAATGFTASKPLLEKAGELIGITAFFTNFVTIVVLLLAWLIVLLAFFVLAVQLFIAIIEFKLTTLAGFVLVPFAQCAHLFPADLLHARHPILHAIDVHHAG